MKNTKSIVALTAVAAIFLASSAIAATPKLGGTNAASSPNTHVKAKAAKTAVKVKTGSAATQR